MPGILGPFLSLFCEAGPTCDFLDAISLSVASLPLVSRPLFITLMSTKQATWKIFIKQIKTQPVNMTMRVTWKI